MDVFNTEVKTTIMHAYEVLSRNKVVP